MGKYNNKNRNKNFEGNRPPQNDRPNNKQFSRPPKAPKYKGNDVDPMGDVGRMGRHAIGIFKDIAKGRARPYGSYTEFNNKDFLVGAIDEIAAKMREHNIYIFALRSAYGGTNDPQVITMVNKHVKALEGWTYVYQSMNQMLMTGDTSILLGLMNRLPDYRYVLY